MKFESEISIPGAFIENIAKKVEVSGLNLPLNPDQVEKECDGNPNCERAFSEMLNYAIRYAADVWKMKELATEKNKYTEDDWSAKLAKMESERTQLHDVMIDSIAILSRSMNKAGLDNNWIKELAPAGKLERALCGKFAIMLTYWLSVNRE